jgi:N-acetylneuraminic acid mutarotase
MSRKSSKKNLKKSGKEIIGMNTFSNNSSRRYLHFFQHDENILHYLDLDGGSEFQSINLSINFKLPDFHKSISVSNGDLYLIAGADPNVPEKKVPNIYKYDFQANTLQLVNKLKYGRSSHSICFNNRYIYVLGGYLNNQNLTNRC